MITRGSSAFPAGSHCSIRDSPLLFSFRLGLVGETSNSTATTQGLPFDENHSRRETPRARLACNQVAAVRAVHMPSRIDLQIRRCLSGATGCPVVHTKYIGRSPATLENQIRVSSMGLVIEVLGGHRSVSLRLSLSLVSVP